MLGRDLLMVGCLAAFPLASAATIVEVPLPGLCGAYTFGQNTRVQSFDLGAPIDTVLGGWIRWSGTMVAGSAHGDGVCGDPDVWVPWLAGLIAVVDPSEAGTQWAHIEPAAGPFAATTKFAPFMFASSGWPSILDGRGTVRLEFAANMFVCATGVVPPEASVVEATLILEIKVPTPARCTTWGHIKALYR